MNKEVRSYLDRAEVSEAVARQTLVDGNAFVAVIKALLAP